VPQWASGRWRMPCGGPSPLLAGWRGSTSRPNHFCQLDSKTTHTEKLHIRILLPISPSDKSSNMAPTLGQVSPTLHLRASHSAPGATCPRPPGQPPCQGSPTLHPCLPYTSGSATLYRVPPTLHLSRGAGALVGDRLRARPPEPSIKKPPQYKGTQIAAPTSKNSTFTYPVPGSGAPPALLTYPPTGFWPTARQDGLPVRL
jgi:hypothetical protein